MTLTEQKKPRFIDLISNPDGTISTKRSVGWVYVIASIVIAFAGLLHPDMNEAIFITVFGGFITAALGSLGISSYDAKVYHAANSFPANTGDPQNSSPV